MAEQKLKVVGVGEVLWDVYREKKYLGGAPANFVLHCHQLGDEGVLVSRIGNDGMGKELLRTLAARGLSAEFIQQDRKKGTGTVFIRLSVDGNPTYNCSHDVAFDYLQTEKALSSLTSLADAVYYTSLGLRGAASRETILGLLAETTAVRVYDVNQIPWAQPLDVLQNALRVADILKMTTAELLQVQHVFQKQGDHAVAFLRRLMQEFGVRFVALTEGENGARLIFPDKVYAVNAVELAAVDTTGAGDAFTAGLVHYYLRQYAPAEALLRASLLGAFVATRQGAAPEYSPGEFDAFCRSKANQLTVKTILR